MHCWLDEAQILPLPVDDDGLQIAALPTGSQVPPLVYVTPSHQYPLGMRLSITRRMDLLAWAEAHDSLIIEDDYDSEFRFDAPPLPALAAIDQHRHVAYIGTFSKILTPALRVGYIMAPAVLLKRIEQRIVQTGAHVPGQCNKHCLRLSMMDTLNVIFAVCAVTMLRNVRC